MTEFFQNYGSTFIMIGALVLVFVLMWRSNKKQERETQDMRNSLEIGDEITTIGGIIGEIVRIKEETVTIETGKDRTKIRVLRSAIRSVDVHASEKRGETKKAEAKPNAEENQSEAKKNSKIKTAKLKKEKAVANDSVDSARSEKSNEATEAAE